MKEVIALVFVLALISCATDLKVERHVEGLKENAVVLMTARISNVRNPDYPPTFARLLIKATEEIFYNDMAQNDQSPFTDEAFFSFKRIKLIRDEFLEPERRYVQFLVIFSLPPGKYRIMKVQGSCMGNGLIGGFNIPIEKNITVSAGEICYVGNLDAQNVYRETSHEIASGPLLPLLDQLQTGLAQGTFRLSLYDNYVKDAELINTELPEIKDYFIKKQISEIKPTRPIKPRNALDLLEKDKQGDNIETKLLKLKNFFNDGLITQEEYDKKRDELMNSF